MSLPKILANGPLDPIAYEILGSLATLEVATDTSEAALLPLLKDAVGYIARGDGTFNARMIEASPNIRVIARTGVGYNNVDITRATERKIPVVYTPGAGARAVAEASMTWMLALSKHVVFWNEQVRAGNWSSRFDRKGGDLQGATLGIIGLGRIGQDLAKLASPFEMNVIAFDPYIPDEIAKELEVDKVDLQTLMSTSDFICIHAAATEENRGLINRSTLQIVKRGAYLINLARGEFIENLDDLYEALQDGRLAGVGLDVFTSEPPEKHPLFSHPACLTAPHALASTEGAMKSIFRSMCNDIAAILRGERPRFVVNPEVFEAS